MMTYSPFSGYAGNAVKRIVIALALLLILSWCVLLPAATADLARVVVRKANVRSAQKTSAKIVGTFFKGDTLTLVESSGTWHKVRLDDGREGWIFAKQVEVERDRSAPQIEETAKRVLGENLRWANLNEFYLEEYQTARLDVMVDSDWLRLKREEQERTMIALAREFAQICEQDDLLRTHRREKPYVVFFDRFNSLIGKANDVAAVFAADAN